MVLLPWEPFEDPAISWEKIHGQACLGLVDAAYNKALENMRTHTHTFVACVALLHLFFFGFRENKPNSFNTCHFPRLPTPAFFQTGATLDFTTYLTNKEK